MASMAKKIVDPMVGLLVLGLLLAIFTPISLNFVIQGADSVSNWANDTITEKNLTSSDSSYFLFNMLANDDLVTILFVSVFILILVGIALGMIYKAVADIGGKR